MLTEDQKRGLEWLYNSYSFDKGYALKFLKSKEEEWSNKMMALRGAVSILGYKFEPKGIVNEYGVEYPKYELVEIDK